MPPRSFARRMFRFVLYAYAAAVVLVLLLLRGISTYDWATVPMLVDGTAYRPFVTRAFMPTIVRTIVQATPALAERVESRITGLLEHSRPGLHADRALATLGWAPDTVYVHLVATFVMFVAFLLLPYAWRRTLIAMYELPPLVAELAPAIALLALPLFFVPYARYLYDPGTLLLWAVALCLVVERRSALVWLLLPVIAYHKETAVLLPLVVALRAPAGQSRVRTALELIAQLAVVAGIRFAVGRAYAANPGDVVLWVGIGHTRELIMEFLHRPPYVPVVVALLLAVVASGWGRAPVFLKRAFLAVLVPLVLLGCLFGFVDEIRGYYEAYAIGLLIAVPGVTALLGAGEARVRESAA